MPRKTNGSSLILVRLLDDIVKYGAILIAVSVPSHKSDHFLEARIVIIPKGGCGELVPERVAGTQISP